MTRRIGLSLIEILVVIAIIAILIGLLLPAVQKVRDSANKTISQNKVKQIQLAVQSFASDRDGLLPSADGGAGTAAPKQSVFMAILPYIEQGNVQTQYGLFVAQTAVMPRLDAFVSPADPTQRPGIPLSSYAANAQVFNGTPTIPASFSDGTSTTIAFAEHYAYGCQTDTFIWPWYQNDPFGTRRATFADGGSVFNRNNPGDCYPVTTGNPPVSNAAFFNFTFQAAPNMVTSPCNPTVAQTPHKSGMIVGMADGSVRTISSSVSKQVYWGAVTPNGGEIIALD